MADEQTEEFRRPDRGNGSGQHDPMQAASSAAGQASEAVQGQIDEAKRRAADGARQAADAAREAARNLRGGDQAWMAGLVERGADGLTDLAETLRSNDLSGLLRRAEEFARTQPVLFAGAALALGFALTRAARAATTQTTERREYGREH
jgi:hypothetical protein